LFVNREAVLPCRIYPTQQSTTFDAVIAKQIFPLKLSEAEDEATREVGLKFAKSLLKKR
jgi:hypothetical protein